MLSMSSSCSYSYDTQEAQEEPLTQISPALLRTLLRGIHNFGGSELQPTGWDVDIKATHKHKPSTARDVNIEVKYICFYF